MIEIMKENLKYRDKDQIDAIKIIRNINNSRKKVIELYNDYARIISEAMYKAKNGTVLKILTPKKMLQRLQIALAQVKADNSFRKFIK